MRHISLDLIRVTEAAAIAASAWIGSGNKEMADKAATDAMRNRLNKMDFSGTIVIGEGQKDNSYGLFAGECVGKYGIPYCGHEPSAGSVGEFELNKNIRPKTYDIAVDPIEGTTPTVTSGPEAISVIAVANEGAMYSTPSFYMRKLAYGKNIKDKITLDINEPIERTLDLTSRATGKDLSKIVVCILNRPRHQDIIIKLRHMGVRIKLIQDCDVSGAVASCLQNSGVDLLYGIGGSPEAVISACAIKCLGGDFQAVVVDDKWNDVGKTLKINNLIDGDCIFAATGITNGSILKGVRTTESGPITNSVFMRSESGTIRWLEAQHGN